MPELNQSFKGISNLAEIVQELSLARDIVTIMGIVRKAARTFTGADGATFILREGDKCHYADEDAITPLWKGSRFPMSACISGWVMLNCKEAVIEDIYSDDRIPVDAYRPTFVKSLLMVPIRKNDPIGAIGNYWASPHLSTPEEVAVLQALADTTAVAMENIQVYFQLEHHLKELKISNDQLQIELRERQRMEDERMRHASQLQQAQKLESLGILAGGIAHDFNNLLGGILGCIDMASEETKEANVTSYLSKAMSTIDRARALTQQLLTFAKGGAPLQKIENLFPFVKETAQFALSGANVSCHFDVPQDLWLCNFDKNQIGQVIGNLIINAQQAMPVGGTIELAARNIALAQKEHPLLAKGNYVKISVKDTGIGISKELIAKIFDPFFTTKAKGHGLGLATSYSIINRHGGCIDVESEQGKGSTFKVYLPAATEVAMAAIKKVAKTHKGSGTFLVMDDEEVMRETIGDMLETFGYAVVSKQNGQEAVDFYLSETNLNRQITGMIFDLTVPGGMGGKTAIEEIRKSNIEIPAFVASGYSDDPVMKNPTEYGFMTSICKPFRKSELSEILNNHIKPKE